MTATELPAPTHADRLAAAAAITAKAQAEVTRHDELAEEVRRLKLAAAAGDLDDAGAGELVKKSEALRLAAIVQPRRRKALDDALAAEVVVGLEVLAALSDALAPVEAEAAQAADKLTEALVCPLAAALEEDTVLARDLGVARCSVERGMPGVYGASVLREKIDNGLRTSWGSAHVPATAREIVESFNAETAAIRSGINGLLAVHKAAAKVFG